MKANTSKPGTAVKKVARKKSVANRTMGTQRPTRAKSSGNGNAGHGGQRRGAGRKPSSATTKTREIANAASGDGELLPLEYLLKVLRTGPEELRARHEAGELDDIEYRLLLEKCVERRDWAAEKAAPYCHARLSSIEANVGLIGQDAWVMRKAALEDHDRQALSEGGA